MDSPKLIIHQVMTNYIAGDMAQHIVDALENAGYRIMSPQEIRAIKDNHMAIIAGQVYPRRPDRE
jgi:hypothetical protein